MSLACPDRSVLIFGVKLALAPKELISTSLHEESRSLEGKPSLICHQATPPSLKLYVS